MSVLASPRSPWLPVVLLLSALPLARAARAEDPPGYEEPRAVRAAEVLEPVLRKGPNHEVRDAVERRRMLDAYELQTPYGLYRVTSHRLLEIRVQEVETIARVVGMEGAPEGLRALGQSLGQLPGAAVEIVLHPIDSAEQIGAGLAKTWGRIEDLFRRRHRSVYEDGDAEDLFAGDEKRHLAAELHLDVYSTNPRVQTFLGEIARWRAAGHLTLDVATFALPFAGYAAVHAMQWRADVDRLLRDKTPAELQRHNANLLLGLGIPRAEVGPFLEAPWLSPRHETVVAAALARMSGVQGLEQALRAATLARDEAGALYHEQQVELLAHHHLAVEPLVRLSRVRHVVAGRVRGGDVVVMLPADEVYWMQDLDHLADDLARLAGSGPSARVRLYATGRVTPRAQGALQAKGFRVVAGYRPAPTSGVVRVGDGFAFARTSLAGLGDLAGLPVVATREQGRVRLHRTGPGRPILVSSFQRRGAQTAHREATLDGGAGDLLLEAPLGASPNAGHADDHAAALARLLVQAGLDVGRAERATRQPPSPWFEDGLRVFLVLDGETARALRSSAPEPQPMLVVVDLPTP